MLGYALCTVQKVAWRKVEAGRMRQGKGFELLGWVLCLAGGVQRGGGGSSSIITKFRLGWEFRILAKNVKVALGTARSEACIAMWVLGTRLAFALRRRKIKKSLNRVCLRLKVVTVCTSQWTQSASVREISRLMLCRETVAVYCKVQTTLSCTVWRKCGIRSGKNCTVHVLAALCGANAEFVVVKTARYICKLHCVAQMRNS
jgi:hypothetical protein